MNDTEETFIVSAAATLIIAVLSLLSYSVYSSYMEKLQTESYINAGYTEVMEPYAYRKIWVKFPIYEPAPCPPPAEPNN